MTTLLAQGSVARATRSQALAVADCRDSEQGSGELIHEQSALPLWQERRPRECLINRCVEPRRVVDEEVSQQPSEHVECFVPILLAFGLAQTEGGGVAPSEDDIVIGEVRDDVVGLT